MIEDCYVPSPIYYVNDEPHLGRAHTIVLADLLAKCRRIQGKRVFFLAATDEYRQKVQDAAVKNCIDPNAQDGDRVLVAQDPCDTHSMHANSEYPVRIRG